MTGKRAGFGASAPISKRVRPRHDFADDLRGEATLRTLYFTAISMMG